MTLDISDRDHIDQGIAMTRDLARHTDAVLRVVNRKLDGLAVGQEVMQTDVATLTGDVSSLKVGQATLKADVATLQAGQTALKVGQEEMKADMTGMKADMTGMKGDIAGLKATQREMLETMNDNFLKLFRMVKAGGTIGGSDD
jgi:peptidoglycan hydrolase CwlO-like protein